VGDDCIAIKAGKRGPGATDHLAPCEDITVRHCEMRFGHGAVVLGSEMSGDIRRVAIENCEFTQTDRGLRLKTRRGRGGVIEDISMHNVEMTGVDTPLAANAFYFCDADGKSDWVQSRRPARVDDTTPCISNITLENVTADNVTLAAAALLGLPEAPITDITLSNFAVTYDPDAQSDVPLMAVGVPAVRHGGVIAEFATVSGDITVSAQKVLPTC
jgi:polygalacturonase